MIGYAAASQSAQQVTAMLGGPPASDRRVQDQLNELLASKSRPELWEVLRLLKEFLGGDRQAASQYFGERPGLTKAVFQAQVLLGESGGRGSGARVTDLLQLLIVGYSMIGCAGEGNSLGSCRHRIMLLCVDVLDSRLQCVAAATWLVLSGYGHVNPCRRLTYTSRSDADVCRITESTSCVKLWDGPSE
jgi:hypothetical protein